MPTILDRVPILERGDLAFVGAEPVRVKAYEIIAWISLTPESVSRWDDGPPVFPAAIDTAHTHNFSLQHRHLIRWTGLRPERLRQLGEIRLAGRMIPIYAVDVRVHFNEPGKRDRLLDRPPFHILLQRGIAVHPDEPRYPRIPVLGLRAIITNRLDLAVSGARRFASLRTPRRFWFFG